jgi:hypothetical protein
LFIIRFLFVSERPGKIFVHGQIEAFNPRDAFISFIINKRNIHNGDGINSKRKSQTTKVLLWQVNDLSY